MSANFETSPFEVCAYLSDICVPDERDLSTGLNFDSRNIQCIPMVKPDLKLGCLPPLKVRDLRLDLEQISGDFEIEYFETG